MNQEQLQALISGFTLPSDGAFDSAALFDQLTEATAPLADVSTLEYREQLFHGATEGLDQLVGAIPTEVRNFSDPSGFIQTYSTGETSTTEVTRILTRTISNSESSSDGLLLGEGTPLETNAFHDAETASSTTTTRSGIVTSSSETQNDTFVIDNQLVNLNLQHTDTDNTIFGQNVQTSTTSLSLDLADMAILDVGLTDLTLRGQPLEVLSLSYPNAEGGQDSLALPTSTNILLPLALGAAEGFVNNPDPTALLDTLTGLADLPEPIGALAGGDNPLAGLGLPALPA